MFLRFFVLVSSLTYISYVTCSIFGAKAMCRDNTVDVVEPGMNRVRGTSRNSDTISRTEEELDHHASTPTSTPNSPTGSSTSSTTTSSSFTNNNSKSSFSLKPTLLKSVKSIQRGINILGLNSHPLSSNPQFQDMKTNHLCVPNVPKKRRPTRRRNNNNNDYPSSSSSSPYRNSITIIQKKQPPVV